MIKTIYTDILIAGCGVSGLYAALNLPEDKKILIITKSKKEESDSFLAQGGICVLRDENDFQSFFDDTLRAGHFENSHAAVSEMINSSRSVISDLEAYGTRFTKNKNGEFEYTKEGAHSKPRILYHKDETGKEITSSLLEVALKKENITLYENFTLVDILEKNGNCYGGLCQDKDGVFYLVYADYTIMATGGIGGLFKHSTNFPHLTGDALAIAHKHNIPLKNPDYIQIHPTTFYTEDRERSFLISESVRGEGALLYNHKGERFVDELLPRDVVADAIFKEMEKEKVDYMWLSLKTIPEEEIYSHFPNIVEYCKKKGINLPKDCIPVVPAQHYYMGGVEIDLDGRTSISRLYAVGETACNNVHGKNRLASNSLLESMVFAKRAAKNITEIYTKNEKENFEININDYNNYQQEYELIIKNEI